MEYLSLDLESRSKIDIKLGAWRYAEDPSTQIFHIAFAFPDQDPFLWWWGTPFPQSVIDWVKAGKPVRAFNAEFEAAMWKHHIQPLIGCKLSVNQLYCTQAEAIAMSLPAALAECGTALGVAEEHLKDPQGKKLIQYLCRPYRGKFREDPVRLADLGEYCEQDVVAEQAIATRVRRLDPEELKLWRRTLVMNSRGLPVDMHQVHAMRRRWHELKTAAIEECQARTGFSPTQVAKLQEYTGLENMQKKTVERAIADGHPHSDILKLRQVAGSTSLAKLDKLPLAVCKDGTMKGLFKFHGASTGRYVSQGGFNGQNLPRGDFEELEQYKYALENIPILDHKELISILRTVFAFPMTVLDYSQIETRMLLWLAGDIAGLDEFRRKLDPYQTMAARIYGVRYFPDIGDKKDPRNEVTKGQRQMGKSAVLGAGYQLGWKGFIGYCDGLDITVTEEEARMVIDAFRSKYAAVTEAWKACQNAAVKAIKNKGVEFYAAKSTFVCKNNYLWVILPSGRRIAYRKPWLTPGKEEWMGPQINYWGRDRYTRKWSKQTTYGGSLFQSITQGSARDVMAHGMHNAWNMGLDLRGTVHDEVITYDHCIEELGQALTDLPAWCQGLPMEIDGWEGGFYRK